MQWKNWDGKKVYTVNAGHVEYIELERFPVTDKILELSKKSKAIERWFAQRTKPKHSETERT
jgi:hypothetical protein